MAAKIKLKRIGKKKKPFYRIVVQDESFSTRGRITDEIGTYDPMLASEKVKLVADKAKAWLKKGATPTDRVRILLGNAGILPKVSFEGRKKKSPKSAEGAEGAQSPAPQAAAPALKEEPKKEEIKTEAPKPEAKKAEEPKVEEQKAA